jgi:hypothetical protein
MNLKNRLVILIVFFAGIVFSQSPVWQWARGAGGTGAENGNSVTRDASGNVIVAGYFYSPSVTAGNFTLTNNGNYDMFVAKYDGSGNLLWASSGGGTYDDVALSVTTDSDNNIYATGYFYSPTVSAGNFTLSNNGTGDVFVIKFDALGNILWLKGYGGAGDESGMGISCKSSGNPILCGWFQSAAMAMGSGTLSTAGGDDVFLTELDASGNILWARSYGETSSEIGSCVCVNQDNEIFLGGHFSSPTFTIAATTLTNSGSSDFFIAKCDAGGNLLWAKNGGGIYNDMASSLSADRFGNVVLCGTFLSPTLNIGTQTYAHAGGFDYYLAKFSPAGGLVWARTEGDIFDETAYGVATDWAGNVIVTGHFHSPSVIIGNDTLNNTGIGDVYLACYDSVGTWRWTEQLGGTADDGSSGLACGGAGEIFLSGYFISANIARPEFTLTNKGGEDLFVAKLKTDLVLTSIHSEQKVLEMSIFPNPSDGTIYFKGGEQIIWIELFDIAGKRRTIFETHKTFGSIDVSGYSRGIYVLRAHSESGVFTEKILLK